MHRLSIGQREILGWLARGGIVERWRCRDGTRRWHAGEGEVDGRCVRGLRYRGLVEIDTGGACPLLILTDAGRAALGAMSTAGEEERR